MSTQAVQTVVNNMPAGIGAEIYAPAAASLYRLGVNGEGASFAEALQMTGKGSALSGRVQQVLALGNAGRTALALAYTQGEGEAEHYKEIESGRAGQAARDDETRRGTVGTDGRTDDDGRTDGRDDGRRTYRTYVRRTDGRTERTDGPTDRNRPGTGLPDGFGNGYGRSGDGSGG